MWFGSGQRLLRTAFDTAIGIEKVSQNDMLEVIKAGS
jgi:hypothetical protein